MKEFFKLNKKKLWLSFKFISISFLSLTLILLLVEKINGNFPKPQLLIKIIAFAAILLPLFCILLASLFFIIKFKIKYKTVFKKIDLIKEKTIEVNTTYINDDTNWFFTELSREIIIDNYKILVFIDEYTKPKETFLSINFEDVFHIDLDALKKINALNSSIFIDDYRKSIVKIYKSKEIKKIDVKIFKKEVIEFIEVIKQHSFIPKTNL